MWVTIFSLGINLKALRANTSGKRAEFIKNTHSDLLIITVIIIIYVYMKCLHFCLDITIYVDCYALLGNEIQPFTVTLT